MNLGWVNLGVRVEPRSRGAIAPNEGGGSRGGVLQAAQTGNGRLHEGWRFSFGKMHQLPILRDSLPQQSEIRPHHKLAWAQVGGGQTV